MTAWIIALIGAILAAAGDWLTLMSIRMNNIYLLYIAIILWGLCGVPWYLLLKYYTGWISGSVIWGVIGVVFSLLLAVMSREKQTTIQWVGLVIMFLGITIRSIKWETILQVWGWLKSIIPMVK